jgi:oligopeptidase A
VRRLWPKFFPFEREKKDAHPCSFFPIFSEEWAAAYYSHTWARMIAADTFSALKEVGLDNKDEARKVGRRSVKSPASHLNHFFLLVLYV